jgi:hypothetical protein
MLTDTPSTRKKSAGGEINSLRAAVPELCHLAVNGLVPMFDIPKQLFCHRLNQTSQGMVMEGISPRYSIMTLLGLHRFEADGLRQVPFDMRAITSRMLDNPAWIDNIGDLGLLLWLCAAVAPARLEETYAKLGVQAALEQFPGESRTMELSWFLSGLAHAKLVAGGDLLGLAKLAETTRQRTCANQGKHGYFGHSGKNGSLKSVLRAHVGSFADQVYPIYALSKFGTAFQDQSALGAAANCAEAICQAQGSLGQWWWHYNAATGKVAQRYPVYSVHQHAMGPMALFALTEAAGLDFSGFIYRGLGWIYSKNEIERDMRDSSSSIVWRSLCRQNRGKMYLAEFIDSLSIQSRPVNPDDLAITFECRPYELGWLLYAFAEHYKPQDATGTGRSQ